MSITKYTTTATKGRFAPKYVYPSVESNSGYFVGMGELSNPHAERHARAMKAVLEAAVAETKAYRNQFQDCGPKSIAKWERAVLKTRAAVERLEKLEANFSKLEKAWLAKVQAEKELSKNHPPREW